MTPEDLIAFEQGIADLFNSGQIRHPVHLADGNEDALIRIFENIGPDDWVFGSWRMHYHALLKGVPRETLKAAIMRGESMALRFDEHRVYGSAIVGGIVPIALGAALAVKRRGGSERVWLFVGDMTFSTGIMLQSMLYARGQALPMNVVIENNGISVCTPTAEAWGTERFNTVMVTEYRYQSRYPHAGAGKRVEF